MSDRPLDNPMTSEPMVCARCGGLLSHGGSAVCFQCKQSLEEERAEQGDDDAGLAD